MCPSDPKSVDCDFEEGTCGYTSDDNYLDWIRTNGSTTGTDIIGTIFSILINLFYISLNLLLINYNRIDHTLGTSYGFYMFAKQKLGSPQSYVSRLKSITLVDLSVKCLSFYFLMYGDADYNILDVLIKQSSTYSLWSTSYADSAFDPNFVKFLSNSLVERNRGIW